MILGFPLKTPYFLKIYIIEFFRKVFCVYPNIKTEVFKVPFTKCFQNFILRDRNYES
ncbi:hypothetical protein LEP1GSC166_3827 [Leptospira kirschneri]|nr:hypothetical protein LEP1GSC166_3827 [Leptospira kirschneri]